MQSRPSAQEILASLAKEVESRLKPRLVAMGGFVLRSQLPQLWTFKVDEEEISFSMDKQGSIALSKGLLPNPDVRIVTTYDRLVVALKSATPGETPPATQGVSFGSNKGRRAFFYVRKSLRI